MHYSNKSYETEGSFLNHKKGKQKLAFEGYMYICDRKTENKTYWKCESGLCRGRLITTHKDSEVEARPTKEHNHVFVTLCQLSKKFWINHGRIS